MNRIGVFFVTLVFWATAAQAQGAAASKTLCFFSLNNSREYQLTRAFLEANGSGGGELRVVELHDPGEEANPETSFRRVLESRQACDGLVISGHHTGSFGGNLASGVLSIRFLEQLSCDPQYGDFFQRVRALWLQGCRTLGIGPLRSGAETGREAQADYHMQRVGAALIRDGLEQSFSDLSFEFSTTLDRDNPLASRYLRVFPAANVFGWTRSSPGEQAGSERSLLYHMAHLTHLSQGVPLFDPLKASSPALRGAVSRSLGAVLAGDPLSGRWAREAWLSHGRASAATIGFDNPYLNAYPPLLQSPEEELLLASKLGCEMRNAASFGQLQAVLDRILLNRDFVAYNLSIIRETFQDYGRDHPAESDALQRQLVGRAPLMSLLDSKLKSPRTGLLMKIEYYSFFRQLTGISVDEVEALILEHVRRFLLAQDLSGSEFDIRDFRESLLSSIASHQLADTSFYRSLLQAPDAHSAALYALTWSFVKNPPPEAEILIREIVSHPAADSGTLRGAALWALKYGSAGESDLLDDILRHPEVDEKTLGTVAAVLAEHELPGSEELVRQIVNHPRSGNEALRQASLAVRKYDIGIEKSVLEEMLSHPALDEWGVQNVARVIVQRPALGDSTSLAKIVHHERVDAEALNSLAIALANDSYDAWPELLDSIRSHPKANARTLRYVDRAVTRHQLPSREHAAY